MSHMQACMCCEKDGQFCNKDIESESSPGLGWEGTQNIGYLDFSFLIAYSIGLFISGNLGDRYPVRVIVPAGFLLVSIMTFMFTMGGEWRITSCWYYAFFFTISGFSQSIGWPNYVPVMANWFSKESRGLVLGIWCTCQNVGNICGAILVNVLREYCGMDWMWSLRVISIMIGVLALLNLMFLISEPSSVGIEIDAVEGNLEIKNNINDYKDANGENLSSQSIEMIILNPKEAPESHLKPPSPTNSFLKQNSRHTQDTKFEKKAISFWKAWLIPKVIPYGICIALVKLATYGILLWLPVFADEALHYSHKGIGYLAISYDIGTIIGSVILGKLSDIIYHKRAPIAFAGCLAGSTFFMLVILQPSYIMITIFFVGFFVGGVFNIVAATAAADIAKSNEMDPRDKALATISGIYDGCGSIGSAFGSLVISSIRNASWNGVFVFLSSCIFLASFPIFKVMIHEIKEIFSLREQKRRENIGEKLLSDL
ncbi:unnamed protein product [Moneuplotes crassus]|uniref:Major facilitator superfamily (MFS) profile domain-containing protein n=1 Tax=Euplotes crassus TaxID=5936 RepID=A0AAD1UDN7_EUPCR|nr:unnamed protein product [Moneuplotes crassus]